MRAATLTLLALIGSGCLRAQAPEPAGWPMAAPADLGLASEALTAVAADIRSGKFAKIGSVLIARHGRLAYEEYFDGGVDSLRDTRSATKSITDLLIGIAIDEHKLSGVDARVLDLLPERKASLQNNDPRKERITVEDLLTMSSPLECDDWNDASRGNEERMYLVEDWTQFVLDLPIRGRWYLGKERTPPAFGRYFSYCTGGAFVLGEVLYRATGMRADQYAQEKLFAPLGIGSAQWVYSPLEMPQTGGGLRLRSRDLLTLAQMCLNGGRWNGRQIVSEAWLKASTAPHARIDDATNYAYLWWLKSFGPAVHKSPAYFMSGNGGNKVAVIPGLDMAVVITSSNYNTRGMHEQTEQILDQVLAAVR